MKDNRVNTRLIYIDLPFDFMMTRLKQKYLDELKLDSGPPRSCKYFGESNFEVFLQEISNQSVTFYIRGEKDKADELINFVKKDITEWDKRITSDEPNYA